MDGDRLTTLLGFAGALVVLAALLWLVGIDRVLAVLSRADPSVVAAVLGVAVVWLTAWGMSLRAVLGALGAVVSRPRAVLVLAAAIFSNNVTPFGQAGGEPLTALLISRATDSEYETGLAAIASVDALHFVPSVVLAIGGLAVFGLEIAQLGRNLLLAAAAMGALAVAIPVSVYAGWRYRYELEAAVVRAFTPLFRGIGRVVPGRSPPEPAAIERRIERFFAAIDRVAGNRRTLAAALVFSLAGWLALVTSLWLSLYALGTGVAVSAVLVAVPAAKIAGITPLPGGLGGVEAALVGLLVSTTGIDPATASAAVVVHRGATYWFPTVVGGGVAAALGVGS